MEISIDIEKGCFSVVADINSGEVLQEAISNFFKAYFEKHTHSTDKAHVAVSESFTADLAANELGLTLREGHIVVSSRSVARVYGREYANVLQSIRRLDCSAEFRALNFQAAEYIDARKHRRPEVYMTRDGFTFLVMGYTGLLAAKFKEAYIEAFNAMERALSQK